MVRSMHPPRIILEGWALCSFRISNDIFFFRISLHQNFVFGTTPISLVKPSTSHLLAGGLRWSTQPTTDPYPTRCQDHFISIEDSSDKSPKILIPHLPFISLQDLISETSIACLNCASITSKFIENVSSHILNSFKNWHQTESDRIFDEIFVFLQSIPNLGSLAVSFLGVGTPTIDVSDCSFIFPP